MENEIVIIGWNAYVVLSVGAHWTLQNCATGETVITTGMGGKIVGRM